MPTIAEIKSELESLGIKPNQKMGQNFLLNPVVCQTIVHGLNGKPGDTVLEIGPGLGILTDALLESNAKVIAVEKDYILASFLKKKYLGNANIEIIEGDILSFNPNTYNLTPNTFSVAGNIPYYLTSHIIRLVFENWPLPSSMALTVQLEVAQRITAKPPDMNMLGVLSKYYANVRIAQKISSGNFYPKPDVTSAVVVFETLQPRLDDAKRKRLFQLAAAGFSHNRKQLVNNFMHGLKISRPEAESLIQKAGLDPHQRAETLTIDDWVRLACA
jgi:16S rRNA (adenine1518-N6/adenine1519-N6)-dimethyltransferase